MHVYRSRPSSRARRPSCTCGPSRTSGTSGRRALGEDVTYDPNEHEPHRWPWVDLLGDWTLESFSERLDEARALPRPASPEQARLPRLPPLGVRVGGARPGAEAGAALDRRGARPRVPAGHVRLLDARDLARRLARALPRPALQARPDARVDGRADRRARGPRQRRRASTSRAHYKGTPRRQPCRRRPLPARRGGLPERVDRGSRPDTGDRRRARAVPRPDHVGRADPLVGRRRGAAVRAEVPEREAVALRHARAAARVLRALRGGGHRALRRRPVRARRRPRARSSSSQRSSRADGAERRGAGRLQRGGASPGLETSPLEPLPERYGFRRGVNA